MDFDWIAELDHPRDTVFATHRDQIEALAAHMKNVVRIDVRSRATHAQGKKEISTRWQGEHSEVPLLFRSILQPEMLWWTDHAVWDPNDFVCDWRIELPVLAETVTAKGRREYVSTPGGGTSVRLQGEFTVHPDKFPPVPGVPAFMLKQAAPGLEKFVVNLLEPNLKEAFVAIDAYLS